MVSCALIAHLLETTRKHFHCEAGIRGSDRKRRSNVGPRPGLTVEGGAVPGRVGKESDEVGGTPEFVVVQDKDGDQQGHESVDRLSALFAVNTTEEQEAGARQFAKRRLLLWTANSRRTIKAGSRSCGGNEAAILPIRRFLSLIM